MKQPKPLTQNDDIAYVTYVLLFTSSMQTLIIVCGVKLLIHS